MGSPRRRRDPQQQEAQLKTLKFLLDTHIFLWGLLEPERLPHSFAQVLEKPDIELWVSPITVWETLLLAERGRVVLHPDPISWVRTALQAGPFHEAPLTHEVAIQSRLIELPHQDPADRFLAATALVYRLTLITLDERLLEAPEVPTIPFNAAR